MTAVRQEWLVSLTPAGPVPPRLRVLCLPFAGGGAAAYRPWAAAAPQGVEILAVRLPGRESRIAEAPTTDLAAIVQAILAETAGYDDRPLALFGHSMGTVIAHDLCAAMLVAGRPLAAVMVSGRRAPFLARRGPLRYSLPRAEFIATLRRMGGTPAEVFEHPELLDMVLPTLRADFEIAETFVRPQQPLVSCPLIAVTGTEDDDVPPAEVEAWGQMAAGPFVFRTFPGGHFFLHDVAGDLLSLLMRQAGLR